MIKLTEDSITKIDQTGRETQIEGGIFDEGNERELSDVANKYLDVKKLYVDGVIKRAPHDSNLIKSLKDIHGIEIEDEVFLELREFIESGDYNEWINDRIHEDYARGMREVKSKEKQ